MLDRNGTPYDARIPQVQVRWLVGCMHVGQSDDEVRAEIRKRATSADWTPQLIEQAAEMAVQFHHANQGVYAAVMTGSFN